MIRLGLWCTFRDQPVQFANTTVAPVSKMERLDAMARLSRLGLGNADALRFCAARGIGCFRVNSQILPLTTHPGCGYAVDDPPDSAEVVRRFRACGTFAGENDLRTCVHPD